MTCKRNQPESQSGGLRDFRKQLLLASALVLPSLAGYGRRAYAGPGFGCYSTGPNTYLCSGAITSPQSISADDPVVTMDVGATIDTTGDFDSAISITGNAGSVVFENIDGGDIVGGAHGIDVENNGPGSITITTNSVVAGGGTNILTSEKYAGITAVNKSEFSTDITITANADVTAGQYGHLGIVAGNFGTGSTNITAINVQGDHVGIVAYNGYYGGQAGTDLNITSTGTVSTGADGLLGILAFNAGTGALNINANTVDGGKYGGIVAINIYGTDLSITATGTVSSSPNYGTGIYAGNGGSGALTINAATVTGVDGYGIYAQNSSYGTDLSITATGTVSTGATGNSGIAAYNYGSGALTINAATVTGGEDHGIAAFNSSNGTSLSITATGTVSTGSTGYSGIYARNYGSGALTINAATVTGSEGQGIYAFNSSDGTGLSITATGTVSTGATGQSGIHTINQGNGALTINAATVTGGGDFAAYGISAFNQGNGNGLSITATGIVSTGLTGISGIKATNYGRGALEIQAATVTGGIGHGIYAKNGYDAGNLSITATGPVSTQANGQDGIYARNRGFGSTTITTADVTGGTGSGIDAQNSAFNLTINATGTVSTGAGGSYGILAENSGSGALTINAVDVTGTNRDGIRATNNNGSDLSITTTGTVSTGPSGGNGIWAYNYIGNVLSINAVNVTGGTGDGIWARLSPGGSNLSITTTGTVSTSPSGGNGIFAANVGSGALTINAATVTGGEDNGIYAANSANSTDVSVTSTGTVSTASTGRSGIFVRHAGSGALTINAATVTGGNYHGIQAYASTRGTNLSITATGVVSTGNTGRSGIEAVNYGSSALTINAATVTGGTEDGIFAINGSGKYGGGTDLNITATGTVSTGANGNSGISAINYGSGALTISAATVTGGSGYGIFATNLSGKYPGGTDLSITATGTVSTAANGTSGIYATNYGSGALTINAATVTGGTQHGIYAKNDSTGTDLSITATGTVSTQAGGRDGIHARNYSSGSVTVNATDVTASTIGNGILVHNGFYNSAGVNVTTTGTVSATNGNGIRINDNSAGGVQLLVNNVVSANNAAIDISSSNTTANITVTGAVDGGTRGIHVRYSEGATITVNAGASVTGGTFAIDTSNDYHVGSSNDVINVSGTINGNVRLFNGDDLFNLDAGGTLGPSTLLIDGGSDVDTFRLSGAPGDATASTLDGARHTNFEVLEKRGDNVVTLTGTHQFSLMTVIYSGALDIAGNLVSADVTNQAAITSGGLGTIGTGTITGNLTQLSTGIFSVDADWATSTSDRLDVSGTADLDGFVVVNPFNFPATGGLQTTFTILTAAGGVTDSGIEVVDTAAVDYTLVFPDANTVQLHAFINFTDVNTTDLNQNQTAVGKALNTVINGGGSPGFLPNLLALGTGEQLANALDQLSPAGDGAMFSANMAGGTTLAQQMLSCRVHGAGDAAAIIREGQCVWARGRVARGDFDAGWNGVDHDVRETFVSGGIQHNLGGDWRFGAGFAYQSLETDTASGASTDGDTLHYGAVLKYNPGPWLFAASVTGGHGWHDIKRRVSFGGFTGVATADADTDFVTGQLTAAYLLPFGSYYLKPQISGGVSHQSRDAYQESAPGGMALNVAKNSDTVFYINPALELGADIALQGGGALRPFVRAGASIRDTDSFTTSATFATAPVGTGAFQIETEIDAVVGTIAAGFDLIQPSDSTLRLEYEGEFGDKTTMHSGTLKLSLPY